MAEINPHTANLKATIDASLSRLAEAIDQQTSSEEFKRHLDFIARFHRYSWGNCLLIETQFPQASMIAGFGQWKRLGRNVKAGEKAIRIMAPCPVKRENPKTGDEEERVFFKIACVFDVSQTEGKELPEYAVPDVQEDAHELLAKLEQVAVKRGITVTYEALCDGSYGMSKGGQIVVGTGHSTGQQAKTLAHEICHEALHRTQDGSVDNTLKRKTRELEAEAVAYVVCRHFGLDAEVRASHYIAMWNGDAKSLAASFARISEASRKLINDVEQIADETIEPCCLPQDACEASQNAVLV